MGPLTLASGPAPHPVQVVLVHVQSTTCILHQHTSPTCVNQLHQLAAGRDCDLPLMTTLPSAQLSCTLTPGRLLFQDPKPGISLWQTYVQIVSVILFQSALKTFLLHCLFHMSCPYDDLPCSSTLEIVNIL